MDRTVVQSADAPAAVGAYSQAVLAKGARTLYCSGQIALDPRTGTMVGNGDVVAETEQVLRNLNAVLHAAGMSFRNVVRAGIYLADMGDFAKVNEIYGMHFGEFPPARSTIQAGALPKGARVEIDVIAVGD
jgi:2-iminobutanoate/2-iminopropanoate deaminase